MATDAFRCYLVSKRTDGTVCAELADRELTQLPLGEVLIRVQYSSLNYKDALAATGHPGVVRTFPHVPGIDVAGVVEASDSPRFQPGDQVFSTGHELGVERWGGWSEYVRLPAEWVINLACSCDSTPSNNPHKGVVYSTDAFVVNLSPREAMILGTAGFTAAQCVRALIKHDISPAAGPILVTGASGGVGSIAVALLSRMGYEVTAVSGKPDRVDWLKQLGATRVLSREELLPVPDRPLLTADIAGAIDTVGGATLATVLKRVKQRGCVAACGVVAGADLALTVYPFILRGVTLAGIDSAWCPDDERLKIWRWLAMEYRAASLDIVAQEIDMTELPAAVTQILSGQVAGRTVVKVG